MKKKLLPFVFTATLMLSLTACGSTTQKAADVPSTEVSATTEVVTEIESETEEATEEAVADTETVPTEATEIIEETENEEAPAFTVTDMSAEKYAKSSVNVRKGPSSDYEKVGGLSTNQKVTVTGRADTGWYRISLNGEDAFVSDNYLVDEKVTVAQTPSASQNTNPSQNEAQENQNPQDTQQPQYVAPEQPQEVTPTPEPGTPTPAPTPAPEQIAPDTSYGGGAPAINIGDNWTLDDLNNMTGGTGAATGGSGQGIGGDTSWIE